VNESVVAVQSRKLAHFGGDAERRNSSLPGVELAVADEPSGEGRQSGRP
jgi:hypothetical protein